MRERLEVERAARLPWLVQLAAERKDASVAMNGSAASQPPRSLALSPAQVARAQKELRIPKQQVGRSGNPSGFPCDIESEALDNTAGEAGLGDVARAAGDLQEGARHARAAGSGGPPPLWRLC